MGALTRNALPAFLTATLLLWSLSSAEAQETCCMRHIQIAPIEMPPGQKWDFGHWITGSLWRGLTDDAGLGDCPLNCEVSDATFGSFQTQNVEYIVRGRLEVKASGYEDEIWEEGNEPGVQVLAGGGSLIGDWTLHVELADNMRGAILASGQFSWNGTISKILVQRKYIDGPGVYEPYFGGYAYPLIEWAKSFLPRPLDDLLHDYERMPESCVVEPEEDEVEAGDRMTVRISDVSDSKGRPSQPFQRMLVKAEKGRILNGLEKGEYRIFEAGGGTLEIEYEAPEECREQEETITVANSCNITHGLENTVPERTIRTKSFRIVCNQWEGTIAETWEMKAGEDESALAAIMHRGEYDAGKSWRIRVRLKKDRGNENVVIYALDEARLEFFSETLDMKAMRMEREGRTIEMSGRDEAVSRSRKLSKEECDLMLAVQLKKKTYTIRGKIDVGGIAIDGQSRLDVKVKPIVVDKREEAGGTTGINEEIEITGTFKDEKPIRFSGSRDEMAGLPPEWKDFFTALAGKIEWKVSWDLSKRKNN